MSMQSDADGKVVADTGIVTGADEGPAGFQTGMGRVFFEKEGNF